MEVTPDAPSAEAGEGAGDGLEAVLAAHFRVQMNVREWCSCGKWGRYTDFGTPLPPDHHAHVAEQVRNHLGQVLTDARVDVARAMAAEFRNRHYDERGTWAVAADAALAVIAARVGVKP